MFYLHGFLSGPNGIKPQFVRKLGKACGLDVHVPDLNVPSFENLTVTAQVELVESLLAAEAVPPVVIASSMGGFVAIAVANRRRVSVHSLLLMAPAVALPDLTTLSYDKMAAPGGLSLYHPHYGCSKTISDSLVLDFSHWRDFAQYSVPSSVRVSVIHGTDDTVVPIADTLAFVQRNPHAVMHTVDENHILAKAVTLRLVKTILLRDHLDLAGGDLGD